MAITWDVSDTSGLGKNWKDCVENTAEEHGYGSLYYAKRYGDSGGLHVFLTRTKKTFLFITTAKYEFITYTHKDSIYKDEYGSGWGPDVTKI